MSAKDQTVSVGRAAWQGCWGLNLGSLQKQYVYLTARHLPTPTPAPPLSFSPQVLSQPDWPHSLTSCLSLQRCYRNVPSLEVLLHNSATFESWRGRMFKQSWKTIVFFVLLVISPPLSWGRADFFFLVVTVLALWPCLANEMRAKLICTLPPVECL